MTDRLKTPLNRRGFLKKTGGMAVFFGAFTLVGCGDDDDEDATPTRQATSPMGTSTAMADTLYTRLGGNMAITAVVTGFVGIVGADTRINSFFANTNLERLNTLLVEQIGQATGGPEVYTGRDMKTTHAGLEIMEDDFNALVEDLQKAMTDLNVPAMEQGELLAILGPMKPDIVEA